ncbi:jg11726 [Pararge aegeria aegeria]|uniref:Jg11726 protein n=1 Tax=Pararge aegeria aegeria TaxID=348720 RepID=A0A8S4S5E8_9NEOP|nr:jg11726 [Pararge aegeria aegeria]
MARSRGRRTGRGWGAGDAGGLGLCYLYLIDSAARPWPCRHRSPPRGPRPDEPPDNIPRLQDAGIATGTYGAI